METKQIQKAGDNANQVQANTINLTFGITEARAREICLEISEQAIKNNTQEANEIALNRIDKFIELLLPRIQTIEKKFESFSDPSFQVLLRKAELTAACSERESDYKILTELLSHRIKRKDNIKKKASISKAIEIIDQIDDDSLAALTMLFIINNLLPLTGNISEGIQVLSDAYERIGYFDLPTDNLWIDNLSILGCINVAPFSSSNKLEDQIYNRLNGYTCAGIKKNDESYGEALKLLSQQGVNSDILVDHELNEGYVRLNIVQKEAIENLSVILNYNEERMPKCVTKISTSQKECLENVFKLYSKDVGVNSRVKEEFTKLLKSHKSIESIIEWKNKIKTPLSLTSVGSVVAFANAKKIDPTLPDLD